MAISHCLFFPESEFSIRHNKSCNATESWNITSPVGRERVARILGLIVKPEWHTGASIVQWRKLYAFSDLWEIGSRRLQGVPSDHAEMLGACILINMSRWPGVLGSRRLLYGVVMSRKAHDVLLNLVMVIDSIGYWLPTNISEFETDEFEPSYSDKIVISTLFCATGKRIDEVLETHFSWDLVGEIILPRAFYQTDYQRYTFSALVRNQTIGSLYMYVGSFVSSASVRFWLLDNPPLPLRHFIIGG